MEPVQPALESHQEAIVMLIIINVSAQIRWIPAVEPQTLAQVAFANAEVIMHVAYLVKLVALALASVELLHLVRVKPQVHIVM